MSSMACAAGAANVATTTRGRITTILGSSLTVADYFTPFDEAALNAVDNDLGSSGVLLPPDQPGPNPHLAITAGKAGTIYVLNRDNLGQFQNGSDSQIVQSLPGAIGSAFGTPAYFNGNIYFDGAGDPLKEFALNTGTLSSSPISQAASNLGFPGATPSVSANGLSNGIVWTVQTDAYAARSGQAVLHAYDANDLTHELYNSTTRRQPPGNAVKFTVPTIANGHVYVGAVRRVTVYGVH